jgi:hypothetical protein
MQLDFSILKVLACLFSIIASIGSTGCRDDANHDSNLQASFGNSERVFYSCSTATDIEGQRLTFTVRRINSTMPEIDLTVLPSGQNHKLKKKSSELWDNKLFAVRLGLKKDGSGSKSIQVHYKSLDATASFLNGFCNMFCDEYSERVNDTCLDSGKTLDDPYGNAAIDIISGGAIGSLSSVYAALAKKSITSTLVEVVPKSIPLRSMFHGEATKFGVKYFSSIEKESMTLVLRKGKFYWPNGELVDTSAGLSAHQGPGFGIFAVDTAGRIILGLEHSVGRIHHSSLVAGMNVLTAGELKIIQGVLKGASNLSGHYWPSPESLTNFLKVLKAAGVEMSEVTIKLQQTNKL